MDAKYVATFLLVAVMITRIQCGPADGCPKFTQCMIDSGTMFQNVSNPEDANRKYFDTVCSNIDAMVNCTKASDLSQCSALYAVFVVLDTRDQFTKACAKKEGMIELFECIAKDGVLKSVQQCTKSVVDKQSNNKEIIIISCSAISEILKCYEMKGQCSANAVSYIRSIALERPGIVSSAAKMVVNVLLLCMLYMLNRFLLF